MVLEAVCAGQAATMVGTIGDDEIIGTGARDVIVAGPGIAPGRALAGRAFSGQKTKPPTKGISTNDYAANFGDFLQANKQGSPWCFWYGGYEPHRGYEYRSGIAKGGKQLAGGQVPRAAEYNQINQLTHTRGSSIKMSAQKVSAYRARLREGNETCGDLVRSVLLSCWREMNNSKQSATSPHLKFNRPWLYRCVPARRQDHP